MSAPPLAETPPVGAVRGVGALRRIGAVDATRLLQIEVWLLALIPARLVFAPLGGVGQPATLLGLILFLLWAVSVLMPGHGSLRPCVPVRGALAVLWTGVLVSYAVMNWHAVATDELNNADRFLLLLLAFSGVALCAAEGLRNKDEVLRVLRSAVTAIAVMATVALLQFRGLDLTKYIENVPLLAVNGDLAAIQSRGSFVRPAGTALHPIEFGVIVAAALAFALHLAIYDTSSSKYRRWLCLGVIGLAIPISISRSALLGAFIVLVFFLVGAGPAIRVKAAAVLAGFAAVVFVLVPGLIGTLRGFVFAGESDSSITSRTDDYSAVAHFIRNSPWIGRGPSTFLPRYRILDNQYLLSLIEIGIVGLIGLLIVFALPAFLGRGARHRMTDDADRNLGQMFAAAGVAVVVSAATYDALSFPTFTAFTALWTGLAGAYWTVSREHAKARTEPS
jgi:O-antigen ligase